MGSVDIVCSLGRLLIFGSSEEHLSTTGAATSTRTGAVERLVLELFTTAQTSTRRSKYQVPDIVAESLSIACMTRVHNHD